MCPPEPELGTGQSPLSCSGCPRQQECSWDAADTVMETQWHTCMLYATSAHSIERTSYKIFDLYRYLAARSL